MRRHNCYLATVSTTAVVLLVAPPAAHAVDVPAGDWKLTVSGFAAGYEQLGFCDHATVQIAGGFACNAPSAISSRSAVSNGLGVGHFGVSASTQKDGWNLGGAGEIWSGISSGQGVKSGFVETNPSLRQSYVFFGNESVGTFKAGRMFGVFASDALANDMSLAGVGSGGAGVGQVGNSTLGRIGVGYIFADFFPQIQYATPDLGGLQLVASVIQAFDAADLAGVNSPGSLVEHGVPGFMAKANYGWKGPLAGQAWVSGWVQSTSSSDGSQKVTSSAFDVGARLDLGGLSLVGYFFAGDGVGNTAPMRDGIALVNGQLAKRDSNGYYGQLTYKMGDLKLGASYGACNLDPAPGEINTALLVKSNSSVIGGVYYSLGSVVTLAAEWTHTISKDQAGDQVSDNSLAIGASAGF